MGGYAKSFSFFSVSLSVCAVGKFYDRPKEVAPLRGERAPVKKPVDNLKPEGQFYQPGKSPVPRGERADVKKPEDNLRVEGNHVVPFLFFIASSHINLVFL